MDTPTFIAKWSKAKLSERAASQEHFIDLCRLLGVQTPAEVDPVGDTFTFEKGVKVAGPASPGSKGAHGWADVWYKGRFAWEYKRRDKYKNLDEAYAAVDPEGDWDTTWAEVFEETGAGQPLPEGHDLIERREEVEQLILGNLLRLNLSKSS